MSGITFAPPAAPAAAPAPEPTTTTAITPQQLAALLAAAQGAPAAPAPPPAASWGALATLRPATPPPPPPIGIALPIRIELADGSSVKPLLLFGPECAAAEVVRPLIEALLGAGVPLDAWKPKPQDGGRGGRGGRW